MSYKKYIFLSFGLLLTISVSSQSYNLTLPSASNYIHTTAPQEAMTTVPANSVAHDPYKVSEQVQYFDGLGRLVQTVQVAASPNKKDIIQPVAYDEVGREAVKYLPYADASANGGLRATALVGATSSTYTTSDQYKFYQGIASAPNVAVDASPFAKTVFESSPLNRVLQQGAPGADWQPESGHAQAIGYQVNSANEVLLFKVSGTALSTAIAYYDAAQLYVTQLTDEDGHLSKEYKDKEGQVVLKRVIDGATNYDTYYVYDDFGLLRFVLPPEAVAKITQTRGTISANETGSAISTSTTKNAYENKSYLYGNGVTLTLGNGFTFTARAGKSFSVVSGGQINPTDQDNLIYKYQYDERKRMIVKKIPGASEVYMVYDSRDRLVLTQDGEMRKSKKWNFIKYDVQNRPIITGEYTASGADTTAAKLGVLINANTNKFESRGSAIHGYTNVSFPVIADANVCLTVTYYDSYGFSGFRNFDASINNISGVTSYSSRLNGLVTGSKERILGTTQFLTTTNFYDAKYRVIESLRDLYDGATGAYELVCNKYDFVGKVKQSRQVQTFNGVATTIDKYLAYDHAGRLTTTDVQVIGDATGKVTVSDLTYNEIGQLVDKKLHKTATGTFNQSVDYKYNIRGWLTGINEIGASQAGDPYTDLFAERLHYNTVESTTLQNGKLYNGNISAQVWSSNGIIQAYQYAYDGLNRIKDGDYKTYSGVWADATKYEERGITYDLNGNIKTLTRTDELGATTGVNGAAYTYNYNGNQLLNLNGGAAYSYDANGNMTTDGRTGNAFTYNVLNLPQKVSKGADNLYYTYSATGQKLLKNYNNTNNQYYAGNMVYGNTKALDYIIFEEGLIRKLSGGYSWEYNLKDHLGNTRAVFRPRVGDAPELAQVTDYYPFGQQFYVTSAASSTTNKYLYNGKELQDDKLAGSSLNMLDYGARFYDAAIGRFHTRDPLAFKFFDVTPYGYATNNPIKLIDIGGLAPGNIVNSNGQLTRSFIHLMGLTTGVSEETLWTTAIVFSDKFHDNVTGYNSGGITIHNRIIFTEDFDGDNSPSDVSTWFSILPHELGHRVQSDDKSLYLTSYIFESLATAIKEGSIDGNKIHDKIPMEIEAEYIQTKFNKFYNSQNYTRRDGTSGNKLTDLFSYGIKNQDYLISEIDKIWKEYQAGQTQSEEDRQTNKRAMNDVKKLSEGTYKWNGSFWVKQ